jgi:hypothetical protein
VSRADIPWRNRKSIWNNAVSSSHDHIPFALLVDLAEARLAPDDAARAHLAACASCARDMAWLEQVVGLMRSDRSASAPADAIARAKELFRARPPLAPPPARRRVSAVLSFDSAAVPRAQGMRGAGPSERQLLFNAGALDIDLRVAPSGASLPDGRAAWLVSGQLLGAEDGRRVELRGPAWSATSDLDDTGEFALPPVPAGHYALVLLLADFDLDIPDIEIGA